MTDYKDLIERLRGCGYRPPCDEDRMEAADALAALVKEQRASAERLHFTEGLFGASTDRITALQTRVKRMEDALQRVVDTTCNPVPEGKGRPIWNVAKGKLLAFDRSITNARAALAEGDKP